MSIRLGCKVIGVLLLGGSVIAVSACGKGSGSGAGSTQPSSSAGPTAGATSTAAPPTSAAASTTMTPSPSTTARVSSTASPSSSAATTTAAASTTTGRPPLRVTAANAFSEYADGCSTNFTTHNFSARLNFNPGHAAGTVSYHWTRSDGAPGPTQTASIAVGTSLLNLSESWSLGGAGLPEGDYWERVVVTSPNNIVSNKAIIHLSPTICFAN